nr:MAG TPA: hypothetical protein [Caudoviricetes sp.]
MWYAHMPCLSVSVCGGHLGEFVAIIGIWLLIAVYVVRTHALSVSVRLWRTFGGICCYYRNLVIDK